MAHKAVSDHCLPPDSAPGLSLKKALDYYLQALRADLRAKGTIESKRIVLDQLSSYAQEHSWPWVEGITTHHLREYLGAIRERPRWFGKQGHGTISTSY
ncbi:MAG TPA: hypothetical protein VFR55_03700, partial [Dehalococcoidia bacterium]|nr:hypothetical protein [Dehalococcoidia bacterium]